MFLMGCELTVSVYIFQVCSNYLVKTMTSLPINLYHKQYTFTHKWSLLKVAPIYYYYDFSPPLFKNLLNEGLITTSTLYLTHKISIHSDKLCVVPCIDIHVGSCAVSHVARPHPLITFNNLNSNCSHNLYTIFHSVPLLICVMIAV